ncbi:type VI secretion system protein TssL, long form [Inmirania thermothiophila]|uniref:Chemotaxis protein MotB n=1 Tax=Inmirania thermothiophila TaxID=1750597 RepID=A0A3N1Y8G6_9GAMM|nr:type VI secretion system protein TssL, long form [Inmirania thermothiophila]ROR34788.1 chemotaxis protein MotB [Inmirania thermothiophila]
MATGTAKGAAPPPPPPDPPREKKCPPPRAPGWIVTFADLATLLMAFFVLLLSFSEMDVQKYKQIAGSMKNAFGVQRELRTLEPPKGTSIIAREFSPGRPTPDPTKDIRQKTVDENRQTLEFTDARIQEARREAVKLRRLLQQQIRQGLVEVEQREGNVIVRVREKGSFPSGSAELDPGFVPVLETIGKTLEKTEGRIVVAGHTDDVPVHGGPYRSNWELSAARAVSVVHELLARSAIPSKRVAAEGHADTQPLVPNTTPENRARNRRVEIIIQK